MTSEEIKDKYEKRILLILNGIAEGLRECEEHDWKVGAINEIHDDEYKWGMLVSLSDEDPRELDEDDIDVSFAILESEHNDGQEGGVSFSIEAVTVGGSQVARLCPYNYTSDVWVDRTDADAVEERFNLIHGVDTSELVYLINATKEDN